MHEIGYMLAVKVESEAPYRHPDKIQNQEVTWNTSFLAWMVDCVIITAVCVALFTSFGSRFIAGSTFFE
jgi:hypothetical protein